MRYWQTKDLKTRPLITVQVATYLGKDPRQLQALRCLVASFQAQTYAEWELLLTHDGPAPKTVEVTALMNRLTEDKRVRWLETPEREGKFGHRWRHWAVTQHGGGAIVGFTNQDNYYAPVYLEWLASEIVNRKAEFAYCDMVHSHKHWQLLATRPKYKFLDLGGFLAKKSLIEAVRWDDFSFKGDGRYIDALVRKAKKVAKVPAVLFVHN